MFSVTSSCSSSESSSLTTGLALVRPVLLLRPFPRSPPFSFFPRRIFTLTDRAGEAHKRKKIGRQDIRRSLKRTSNTQQTHTFGLRSFLWLVLVFLTLLPLTLFLLLNLLPQACEDWLEDDGVLIYLETHTGGRRGILEHQRLVHDCLRESTKNVLQHSTMLHREAAQPKPEMQMWYNHRSKCFQETPAIFSRVPHKVTHLSSVLLWQYLHFQHYRSLGPLFPKWINLSKFFYFRVANYFSSCPVWP